MSGTAKDRMAKRVGQLERESASSNKKLRVAEEKLRKAEVRATNLDVLLGACKKRRGEMESGLATLVKENGRLNDDVNEQIANARKCAAALQECIDAGELMSARNAELANALEVTEANNRLLGERLARPWWQRVFGR